MCLICVEFQKQRMTVSEARRAFKEMVVDMDRGHAREVREMLDATERSGRDKFEGDDDGSSGS